MSNLQFSVPMNDSVQLLLPLPSYVNPFLIQQLLMPHVNIMPGVSSMVFQCHSGLTLYISINISIQVGPTIGLRVRGQIAINTVEGSLAGRNLKSHTTKNVNHRERSKEIVPLASDHAMPGSVPTSTQ